MIPLKHLLAAGLLTVLAGQAWGGETASTVTSVEMKKSPASDAETVAKLSANTQVEVLKTQGAWKEIKASAGQGWVKMMSLRMGDGSAKGNGGGLSGLGGIVNIARTGSSGNTVGTGAKGVTEENLKNAQPNPEEFKKLEHLGSSAAEARSFAKAGGLKAQSVPFLASTSSSSSNSSGNSPWGNN